MVVLLMLCYKENQAYPVVISVKIIWQHSGFAFEVFVLSLLLLVVVVVLEVVLVVVVVLQINWQKLCL